MKCVYLLMSFMLLFGLVGCGKEDVTTEMVTQEETTESEMEVMTQEEETEIITEAMTREEETEIITEAITQEEETEITTEVIVQEQTEESVEIAGTITPDQALELIVQTFGEVDEQTGNIFSFGHVNTMIVDGVEYHVFTWGWLVNDHVSHLSDLFVKTDGSAIYEGMFVGDEATVYTENNFLD